MNAAREAVRRARLAAAQARLQAERIRAGDVAGPEVRAEGAFGVSSTERAYRGAEGQRILRLWSPGGGSARAAVSADAERVRARARDHERNVGWITAALDSLEANIVGTGIRPAWQLDDAALKQRLHELWNDWVPEADAEGTTDFYGLERLVARAVMRDGEAFVRLRRRRPEDGLSVPLQLQLLEADHLPLEHNEVLPSGREVVQGIEFDGRGRRRAYHLLRHHPGDTVLGRFRDVEPVAVPAAQVVHLFAPTRIGQIRGMSRLAPALVRMWLLARFDEYELTRQYVSSTITGFLQGAQNSFAATEAEQEQEEFTLEPGSFHRIDPYEDVKFPDLPRPTAYERFVPTHLRAGATSIGVTYESMTGDLTGVNYSSIRAGLVEMRRRWQCLQGTLVHQLCKRVAAVWLEQAVLSGVLDLADFMRDRRRYQRIAWIPQGYDWVDPDAEVKAVERSIAANIASRDQVIRERTGRDPVEVDHEIAESNRRLRELQGARQPAPPQQGDGEAPQAPQAPQRRRRA